MPSPPPTGSETKSKEHLPKAAEQKGTFDFTHKHQCLKVQKFPQHSAFTSLSWIFLQQSLLQALGKTQL